MTTPGSQLPPDPRKTLADRVYRTSLSEGDRAVAGAGFRAAGPVALALYAALGAAGFLLAGHARPAPETVRCPRCGGACAPRVRRPDARNPFLASKKAPTEVTCQDCGLDFDPRGDVQRDSGPGRDSGRSPWGGR